MARDHCDPYDSWPVWLMVSMTHDPRDRRQYELMQQCWLEDYSVTLHWAVTNAACPLWSIWLMAQMTHDQYDSSWPTWPVMSQYELMQQCWLEDPNIRPQLTTVLSKCQEINEGKWEFVSLLRNYEGRPINKSQITVVLLIFKISKKPRYITFYYFLYGI